MPDHARISDRGTQVRDDTTIRRRGHAGRPDPAIGQAARGSVEQPSPTPLRSALEGLSGLTLDDVRINYNSGAPARFEARAFARGARIDIARGQEHVLPHEAWHVVQQRQGRVESTAGGAPHVNVDVNLESEADRMGERAMTLAADRTDVKPRPGLRSIVGAASGDLMQLNTYADPNDAAISAQMQAAGITNFGPYLWDDADNRFVLRPGYQPPFGDCVNVELYQPEFKSRPPIKNAASKPIEKYKGALQSERRANALKEHFGDVDQTSPVDQILSVNNGTAPRPFVSLATEDGYCGGHSDQRHILGRGLMAGHRQVALRAAFWKVSNVKMDLDPAGTASVFANVAIATAAVNEAHQNELAANWGQHRRKLAKGTQVKIDTPVTPYPCVAYTKKEHPPGKAYDDVEMPAYIDNSCSGTRELYAGDRAPTELPAHDGTRDPLTVGGTVTWKRVYAIIDPAKRYPGGWAVYTAYPK